MSISVWPWDFALLACKAGAEKSVHRNEWRRGFRLPIVAVNGFADRSTFAGLAPHLPSRRVNVVVADVRGVLPCIPPSTRRGCRDRFLANGGRLLPCRETLFAAVVELPEFHRRLTDAWRIIPELDLSSGLPLVLTSIYRYQLNSESILSQARPWHVLDYSAGATLPAQAHLELPISRSAVCHGLGLWFETRLIGDIGFSTGPASGETVYGNIVLPWLEPVSLLEGEVCCVDLRAHLVGNDYIWQWETNIPAARGHREVRFAQSTFYGSLFPPSVLQKRAMGFVPVLDESGQAERWLLQAMDGKRHLEEIAAEAVRQFPHVFRRVEDAFNRAAEIAEKYSR